MTRPLGRRLAVNPIPYWSRGGRIDKSPAVFDEAFADFARIGFTAVKADVPDGMSAADYLDWIGSYGLTPALSLFNSPFDETIDITDEVERARKFAATQVELGLDRTMISSMAIAGRMAQSAVGADFNADRLRLTIENCGIICQVLQSEGLRPLHHSHVGGVFETEQEITALLDELGPDVIGFGPDTGHLRWAGSSRPRSSGATQTVSTAFTSRTSSPTTSPRTRVHRSRTTSWRRPSGCGASRASESSTSTPYWPRCPMTTTATS
jgi:inosose dehydratase